MIWSWSCGSYWPSLPRNSRAVEHWPWVWFSRGSCFIIEGVRIVPQQSAWVVERLALPRHARAGPSPDHPLLDRVAYSIPEEVPLDVPTDLHHQGQYPARVDGILYYQVTDPRLASYGSSNYIAAISNCADHAGVARSARWSSTRPSSRATRSPADRRLAGRGGPKLGIKVLRYEIKSLTPPEAILRSMQQQITRRAEKRAAHAQNPKARGSRKSPSPMAKSRPGTQVRGRKAGGDQAGHRARRRPYESLRGDGRRVRAVATLCDKGGMDAAKPQVAQQYVKRLRTCEDFEYAYRAYNRKRVAGFRRPAIPCWTGKGRRPGHIVRLCARRGSRGSSGYARPTPRWL